MVGILDGIPSCGIHIIDPCARNLLRHSGIGKNMVNERPCTAIDMRIRRRIILENLLFVSGIEQIGQRAFRDCAIEVAHHQNIGVDSYARQGIHEVGGIALALRFTRIISIVFCLEVVDRQHKTFSCTQLFKRLQTHGVAVVLLGGSGGVAANGFHLVGTIHIARLDISVTGRKTIFDIGIDLFARILVHRHRQITEYRIVYLQLIKYVNVGVYIAQCIDHLLRLCLQLRQSLCIRAVGSIIDHKIIACVLPADHQTPVPDVWDCG